MDTIYNKEAIISKNKDKKHISDKKIYIKFLSIQYKRIKQIDELTKPPKKAEQIRLITQKAFNAFAILLYLVKKNNIDECYLTTYNIDKNTIIGLKELIKDKRIKKLTVVISYAMTSHNPKRVEELKKCVNKNFKLILVNNHTKIILAKIKDNYYVIEGSGNVTANARIEQYLFENSKKTFNFHKSWIEDIKKKEYKDVNIF